MIDALIRKLEQRDHLSDEEKRILARSVSRVRVVAAREDFVREGERLSDSTLVIDGFACRYRILADGRRQITAVHVAGDFVDLHSFLLKRVDHGVAALTRCRVALIPHEALRRITEDEPHLSRLLWLSTLIDAAVHREWLVGLGRRPARGRTAHLLCELFLQLQAVGLTRDGRCRLPLTQTELGDTLGISTVHANRVIQELRADGLITWRDDILEIRDWERLARIAEFDPTYLHFSVEPR